MVMMTLMQDSRRYTDGRMDFWPLGEGKGGVI